MSSRDIFLEKVKQNQPLSVSGLPSLAPLGLENFDIIEKYKSVLPTIGGAFAEVNNYKDIVEFVKKNYDNKKRIITTLPELKEIGCTEWVNHDPHTLENVELIILSAQFGVAENAAVWVTETLSGQRVSTFISQYLAIIVNKKDIVATMHQAYERIDKQEYGFGTFISGPSKTADIEQSLVLGAHGARELMVFLLE